MRQNERFKIAALLLATFLIAPALTGCKRDNSYADRGPVRRVERTEKLKSRTNPADRPSPMPAIKPVAVKRPAAGAAASHLVAPGESLWKIARLYGITVDALCEVNGLDRESPIRSGQTLALPGRGAKPVAARPRIAPEAAKPAAKPAEKPAAPPAFKAPTHKYPWPVQGEVIAPFGGARKGVDIACDGTAFVRAIAPGEVIFAARMEGYGELAIVDHGQGLFSIYGQNRGLLVNRGDKVAEGQKVARGGTPSETNQSRIYFEIRRAERAGGDPAPVEPTRYLR